MAVRFDADGEDYTRALALGSITALTVACWFKIVVDRNTYSAIFYVDNGTSDNWGLSSQVDGTTIETVFDATGQENMGSVTVGTWYFVCLATSGTTGTLYHKTAAASSLTAVSVTSVTANVNAATLRLGESPWGTEWLNGCLAGVKFWTAQLSAAEVAFEAAQYVPNRLTDLAGFYPLVRPETTDYSGNGRTLTGGTNSAREDGPPVPWRIESPRITLPASAGGTTVTGVATGSFGFTGSSNGIDRSLGVATTSLGFTATAAGVDRAVGSAAGSFGFTATASGSVGTPPVTGTASGAFGFTASASGTRQLDGLAAAAFGFAAAASGVDRSLGLAVALFGFTGVTAGIDRSIGAAGAAFGFVATTAGVPNVHGAAQGSFGFTGTAQGFAGTPPVTGTATAVFGFTATAQGQPRTPGVAVAVFTFTASASGRPRVVAAAGGSFGFTGTAAGERSTFGTAQGPLGFTAAIAGLAIPPVVFGTASAATGSAATARAGSMQTASASSATMPVPTATGG